MLLYAHRVLKIFVGLSLLGLAQASPQPEQARPEEKSLLTARTTLEQAVRRAVGEAGGDLETQQLHLIVAFKTGYFREDPLRAIAARDLATNLSADLLVPGDRVTARAFEFGLWPHKSLEQSSASLEAINAATLIDRRNLTSPLWPLTPQAGSAGGHDLERTLVELGSEFEGESNVAIVVLSNFAASQGGGGQPLMGSDAPEYTALLERWTRVEGTQDGATLELPIQMVLPQNRLSQVRLAAVVMVPKIFSGTSFAQGNRSSLGDSTLPSQPNTPANNAGNALPLILGLLALAGIGAAFFLLRGKGGAGRPGKLALEALGRRVSLSSVANGRTLAVLAGKGYVSDNGETVLEVEKAPPVRFARFLRDGAGLKLEHGLENLELTEFNGELPMDPVRLKGEGEYSLVFEGRIAGTGGVPRPLRLSVNVSITREH